VDFSSFWNFFLYFSQKGDSDPHWIRFHFCSIRSENVCGSSTMEYGVLDRYSTSYFKFVVDGELQEKRFLELEAEIRLLMENMATERQNMVQVWQSLELLLIYFI